MTTPLNHFVTEGNVEVYLSKLRKAFDVKARGKLLQLLAAELSTMGETQAHLENAERRVTDGLDRLRRQREYLARLDGARLPTDVATLRLTTLEETQALLEAHCQHLRDAVERHAL